MKVLSRLSPDKLRRVPAIERELIEPIGEVTVNFAMLETILKTGIAQYLFPEGDHGWGQITSSIVTSEMSFRKIVDMFQCLMLYRCPDADLEACRKLCSECYQLEEKRNAIVHSHWAIDHESKATVRLKTTAKGRGLRQQEEPTSKADIVKVADDICLLAKRLEDFISMITPGPPIPT